MSQSIPGRLDYNGAAPTATLHSNVRRNMPSALRCAALSSDEGSEGVVMKPLGGWEKVVECSATHQCRQNKKTA